MSEASDPSDESRSKRTVTTLRIDPRNALARSVCETDHRSLSLTSTGETELLSNPTILTERISIAYAQPHMQDTGQDDSFSDDRYVFEQNQFQRTGSWDESQSLEEVDDRFRSSSRSSSRAGTRDRRKQFDSTTPTLIDEEDDSEILSLECTKIHHNVQSDKDEYTLRRTPGASMYKSIFDSNTENTAKGRDMLESGLAQGRARPVSQSNHHINSHQEQSMQTKIRREPPGLGRGFNVSGALSNSGTAVLPRPQERYGLHPDVWDSTSQVPSQGFPLDQGRRNSAEFTTVPNSRTSLDTSHSSSAGTGVTQGPRDPFPFSSWGRSVRGDEVLSFTQNRDDIRSASNGAFSPNILRLTEDIGNLLHEDDDDDIVLGVSNVALGDQGTNINATQIDWTGSYMFESEAGRSNLKPAVPSRVNANPSNMLSQRDWKPRRRAAATAATTATTSNSLNHNYPSYFGSFPNAQQPKPRIRSADEVFEFGKPPAVESSQIFNFGGAFAPPTPRVGSSVKNSRQLPSLPLQGGFDRIDPHGSRSRIQQNMFNRKNAVEQAPGDFPMGFQGSSLVLLNSRPIDSHPSSTFTSYSRGGIESYQNERMVPTSNNCLSNLPGASPLYGLTQSDMQATAREFVPGSSVGRTNLTSFEQSWPAQQHDWPVQQREWPSQQDWSSQQQEWPAQQQEWSAQQQEWQSTTQQSHNPCYVVSQEPNNWNTVCQVGHGGGYAYGLTHNQSFGDQRSSLTPSPHLSAWAQGDHISQIQQLSHSQLQLPHAQIPMPQNQLQLQPTLHHHQQHQLYPQVFSPQPVSEPKMYYSSIESSYGASDTSNQQNQTNKTTTALNLSGTGSEYAQGTAQRTKKDTKRKQRGKKKTPKPNSPGPVKRAPIVIKKNASTLEQSRIGSTSLTNEDTEDAPVSTFEDPNDSKRSELVESSATRAAFKEFYRTIRNEERLSFKKAEEFAYKSLLDGSLPEHVHWRVYLELADLAKRSNSYAEARRLYKKVCQLQPYASQGWLEYSKLEEECGHMNRVTNILLSGLEFCKYSESLLTRAVKHQEKMGNLPNARELLARFKYVGIEKVWRTVLEGALFEARAGNVTTARRVLKYLMHHVPWYGPLYLEAYKLEKDQGNLLDALQIVERGLQAIPRYGPLWFGAFRICEDMERNKKLCDLPRTMEMVERATVSISKELVWKVHLEAAQMLERSATEQLSIDDPKFDSLLVPARRRLAMTILTCPHNLRWKVWLAAGRMELGIGNTERARSLFLRAHEVVPKKGKSSTLLESARLEDFVGDTDLARAVLCKGRLVYGHDWKVWFESVLLEIRSGNFIRAAEICTVALEIHQGTGRLWATLVQLLQFNGRDGAQQIALRRALNAVPKSGEVWCEGGRIHLNPFSDTFDLLRARHHLFFATRFTPQYGDGFIETIRLELIDQWLSPIASFIWNKTKHTFQPICDSPVENSLTKYITEVAITIAVAYPKDSLKEASLSLLPSPVHQNIVPEIRSQLNPEVLKKAINLSDLRLACVNADPNYGLLWFHCRRRPTDTPRQIIEDAAGDIAAEVQKYSHLYLAAIIRRQAVLSSIETEKPADMELGEENPTWVEYTDRILQAAPSLEEIFNPIDPTTGLGILENTVSGPLFVTGLSDLNRHNPMSTLSLSERRRSFFGNDALFP